MRVEFRCLADGNKLRATATLDENGRVIVTPEPGCRLDTAAIENVYVTESDGTLVTTADGERYLRALPLTFRSQGLLAGFFPTLLLFLL